MSWLPTPPWHSPMRSFACTKMTPCGTAWSTAAAKTCSVTFQPSPHGRSSRSSSRPPRCDGNAARRPPSGLHLQPIPGPEDPRAYREEYREEDDRHAEAHPDADVGDTVEAPAKAADQVDDRVEQGHRLPHRRQHVDRVEAPAEKGERRHDQQRHEL